VKSEKSKVGKWDKLVGGLLERETGARNLDKIYPTFCAPVV